MNETSSERLKGENVGEEEPCRNRSSKKELVKEPPKKSMGSDLLAAMPLGAFFGASEAKSESASPFPGFDVFPEAWRVGPWSRLSKVFLVLLISFDLFSTRWLQSPELLPCQQKQLYGLVALYMFFVQGHALYNYKGFPIVTYTYLAYFLLSMHFLLHSLDFPLAAEILRFPALSMATVTTSVWWLVLLPILMLYADEKTKSSVMKMNFSFFLLNMHFLNLPMALWSHWLLPRALVFVDFWAAALVATFYLLFYLFVLDAKGVPIYIILTPRPWWCIISYSSILMIYGALFWVFSA